MGTPTVFPKLRGDGVTEGQSRSQDNVDTVLRPMAQALSKTPIMGAPPPGWTPIVLAAGFAYTTTNQKLPAFQKDALGYVWAGGGGIQHAAGCAAGTTMFTFPIGHRPSSIIHFAVKGSGATAQFLEVRSNGDVQVEVLIAAGGFIDFFFSFLAEQ